jgi:hypothetical protein
MAKQVRPRSQLVRNCSALVDYSHAHAHNRDGIRTLPDVDACRAIPEAGMVVDLKKLSEALGRSSPEDLRRDLQRILSARKPEIDRTLASVQSYVLRVPRRPPHPHLPQAANRRSHPISTSEVPRAVARDCPRHHLLPHLLDPRPRRPLPLPHLVVCPAQAL